MIKVPGKCAEYLVMKFGGGAGGQKGFVNMEMFLKLRYINRNKRIDHHIHEPGQDDGLKEL